MSTSRRSFLVASLAVPVAAEASALVPQAPAGPPAMNAMPGKAPVIRKRKLGRTGLEVSEVAFGCMITSDQSVIERAADLGVNLFDTARGYQAGNNERLVGAALKGRRDKVYISTKSQGKTKEEALAHLEESLSSSAPTTSTSGTCTPRASPRTSRTTCSTRSASRNSRARSASPASACTPATPR